MLCCGPCWERGPVSGTRVCWQPVGDVDSCSAPNSVGGSGAPSPTPVDAPDDAKEDKKPVCTFKDPAFQHTSKSNNKKRAWRSLKQIIAQERALPWPDSFVHYSSVDALPSFWPAKKYSDISGLPAKYTDPQTKLCYSMAEEFSTVRSLPMDITAGYLALRRANNPVG